MCEEYPLAESSSPPFGPALKVLVRELGELHPMHNLPLPCGCGCATTGKGEGEGKEKQSGLEEGEADRLRYSIEKKGPQARSR